MSCWSSKLVVELLRHRHRRPQPILVARKDPRPSEWMSTIEKPWWLSVKMD